MSTLRLTSLAVLVAFAGPTDSALGAQRGGEPGSVGSTTTTTPAGGTTTTTLPTGQLVAGTKLLLKDNVAKPGKRRLVLLLKDSRVDLGGGNGSADDPTLHGGELRVVSRTGDTFLGVYPLPAESWSYRGKAGKNKGYKFKGTGPIRKIVIKAGKLAKVTGKGSGLLYTLGADPNPVHVVLSIGGRRYCATFGSDPKFTPGKKYLAKKTSPPGACLALVPECGDGILEGNEVCPLLEGPGDMLAVDATSNYDGEPGIPDAEIEEEAPGIQVARTRVELEFSPTATVAEVNAVLEALAGEILMMVSGAPLLVVRIADPGSVEALEATIAAAETPTIQLAKAHFAATDELPPNYDASGNANLSFIDSLLSIGSAAAWNAREAAGVGPLLVIADSFGDGAPTNGVSAVPLAPMADFATGRAAEHGYHVLGIAAADFEGTGFCENGVSPAPAILRGCVTGSNPIPVPLRVVDLKKNVANLSAEMRMVLATAGAAKVVANTSLNDCCDGTCGDLDVSGKLARQWTLLIRSQGLESRMLHLTSAGNIENDAMRCKDGAVVDATTNSRYAAAALLPAIPDMAGTGTIPPLTNTLVVENVVNAGSIPFAPLCLNASSKRPGTISAIGTTVLSHIDSSTNAGQKTGTSMSTPQVAGLAAYLWSLDPDMSVATLKALLQTTTVPVSVGAGGSCAPAGVGPTPIVDAYAAVLGTDRSLMDAPARRAILDVVDAAGALGTNGHFDERDLERFLSELDNAAGARDWSRFDLNGDGRTGGMTTARFDLDVGDPPDWTMVDRPDGLGDPFDETAVTDLDVLCYYANSPLYVGSQEDRATLLAGRPCPVLTLAASLPSSITPGTPETLVVSVLEEDDMGARPLANAYVELTATGGNTMPSSGSTDAQGELAAQVSIDPTANAVEVTARVLTGPGGTELAHTTVASQSTMPPIAANCSVYLAVGVVPSQTTQVGPLMATSTDGPVEVTGSVEAGRTTLEVHYDVDNLPWTFDGGAETIWNDVIEIHPLNPSDAVARMRHRVRFTVASNVNNRTKPEDSQGWFRLETSGFNPGGTFGLEERNLGGDRPERIQEATYEVSAASVTDVRVRTRLSTFTGFGGQTIDAKVDGTATVEWLGIDEVLDFSGNPIPFTYRSLCGGLVGTTTTTSTSTSTTSTSTTTTTSTSTSSTTTPPTATTSTSTTSTTAPGGATSYRLYDATGQDAPTVTLEDQVRMETVDLGSVVHLLVPVAIDGSPVVDADAYETCYAYPGATFTGTAQVSNVFGGQSLDVGDPAALCSPESVTLAPLDDFACYAATGTTVGQAAFLDDGLTAESVTVGDPRFLCVPTRVDGDPLVMPAGALVCYATTTTGAAPGSIAVDNRFGMDTLGVGLPAGVCLSSTVTSLVPGP
jgi:hypothetical protein